MKIKGYIIVRDDLVLRLGPNAKVEVTALRAYDIADTTHPVYDMRGF